MAPLLDRVSSALDREEGEGGASVDSDAILYRSAAKGGASFRMSGGSAEVLVKHSSASASGSGASSSKAKDASGVRIDKDGKVVMSQGDRVRLMDSVLAVQAATAAASSSRDVQVAPTAAKLSKGARMLASMAGVQLAPPASASGSVADLQKELLRARQRELRAASSASAAATGSSSSSGTAASVAGGGSGTASARASSAVSSSSASLSAIAGSKRPRDPLAAGGSGSILRGAVALPVGSKAPAGPLAAAMARGAPTRMVLDGDVVARRVPVLPPGASASRGSGGGDALGDLLGSTDDDVQALLASEHARKTAAAARAKSASLNPRAAAAPAAVPAPATSYSALGHDLITDDELLALDLDSFEPQGGETAASASPSPPLSAGGNVEAFPAPSGNFNPHDDSGSGSDDNGDGNDGELAIVDDGEFDDHVSNELEAFATSSSEGDVDMVSPVPAPAPAPAPSPAGEDPRRLSIGGHGGGISVPRARAPLAQQQPEDDVADDVPLSALMGAAPAIVGAPTRRRPDPLPPASSSGVVANARVSGKGGRASGMQVDEGAGDEPAPLASSFVGASLSQIAASSTAQPVTASAGDDDDNDDVPIVSLSMPGRGGSASIPPAKRQRTEEVEGSSNGDFERPSGLASLDFRPSSGNAGVSQEEEDGELEIELDGSEEEEDGDEKEEEDGPPVASAAPPSVKPAARNSAATAAVPSPPLPRPSAAAPSAPSTTPLPAPPHALLLLASKAPVSSSSSSSSSSSWRPTDPGLRIGPDGRYIPRMDVPEAAAPLASTAAKLARHAPPSPPKAMPPPRPQPVRIAAESRATGMPAPRPKDVVAAAATEEARRRAAAGVGLKTSNSVASAMAIGGHRPGALTSAAIASTASESVAASGARAASALASAVASRVISANGSSSATRAGPVSGSAPAGASSKPISGAAASMAKPGSLAAAMGFGKVDMSSAAVRAALDAGSKHSDQGRSELMSSVLSKTGNMERLEAMEDKMAEVTSREVTRFVCTDCVKEYRKHPEACESEGHQVVAKKRREWAFACVGCGHKTTHTAALCAKPCSRCGKSGWKATSIFSLKSKSGAETLDSTAKLSTHGDAVTESLRGMGGHEF